MALPNLSGSNIQDTFQRVLHTDGNLVHDGTGSLLPIAFGSGNISSSGAIIGNSIVGTIGTAAQTNISSLAHSVTVGTLDRKLTLTGGNSFLAQQPTLTGGAGIINFASGINITGEYKLSFDNDTENTYIKANSDNPEDLEIHADQDIILNPDNQVIVNSNISASGDLFFNNIDGGTF